MNGSWLDRLRGGGFSRGDRVNEGVMCKSWVMCVFNSEERCRGCGASGEDRVMEGVCRVTGGKGWFFFYFILFCFLEYSVCCFGGRVSFL